MSNLTEQQIYESIQLCQLGYWLEAQPNGFRTARTASLTPTLLSMGLVLLGLFVMYGKVTRRSDDAPDWFWWFAGIMIVTIIAVICLTQFRNVEFDCAQMQVSVIILGMTTFQRPFTEFIRFSFDPGYVMNGIDPGGVLYMHFKTGPKMRLLQLRDPKTIQQIQLLIKECMGEKV